MSDMVNAIKGNPDNIKTVTKIDLSCGCGRTWDGTAGPAIVPGLVWACAKHGNQVVLGVDMSIDGTARDAWAWVAQRVGPPQPTTTTVTIQVGPGE